MASSWIRYYPFGDSGGSLFGVTAGYVKGGVGTLTTHLSSHEFYCWVDCGSFVSSWSSDYSSMSHPKKYKSSS